MPGSRDTFTAALLITRYGKRRSRPWLRTSAAITEGGTNRPGNDHSHSRLLPALPHPGAMPTASKFGTRQHLERGQPSIPYRSDESALITDRAAGRR